MADQTLAAQVISLNTQKEVAANTYQTLTAANAGVFVVPKDGKYFLHVVDAAGGAVVTIKAGDGVASGQGDLVSAALTQNLNNFFVIESARFKNSGATDTGKIRVTVSAQVSAALIQLP